MFDKSSSAKDFWITEKEPNSFKSAYLEGFPGYEGPKARCDFVIKVDKKDEEETEKEDIAPIDRYKNLHFGIIRKLNVVFFRVYEPPIVTEVFNVNGNVQNLFKCVNIPKGQGLTGAEIRTLIRKYVEENNLKHETDKTKVKLDPQLAGVVLGE